VNPVLLYFISGESLYSGAALLLVVLALSLFFTNKFARFRNLATWVAVIMMVMAAPPVSLAAITIFLVFFAIWYFVSNSAVSNSNLRTGLTLMFGVVTLWGVALEYPHRQLPNIRHPAAPGLVVIGDSVSAGLDPRIASWPVVMQQATGISVRNLSRVGATTRDAIEMASQVTPEDRIVVVEIGGNDLIAGLPAGEFEKSLDVVLATLSAEKRIVVMMELPLLPDRIGYGRAERRLALKYGVYLVPKRYFVKVISGANATSDGLHLSAEGATRMANLVTLVLSRVLKVSPAT
jgi:acyl-CoA thioesterase-1